MGGDSEIKQQTTNKQHQNGSKTHNQRKSWGTAFTSNRLTASPELSRGGRPGLPVPYKPMVSVDVKQHFNQPTGMDWCDYVLHRIVVILLPVVRTDASC